VIRVKSRKRLKTNSGLNLSSKIIIYLLIFAMSTLALAEPVGVFTRIEEGLPSHGIPGPAWCYDDEANALLITAPERERQSCDLKLELELEKQKIKYDLKISNLELRIETQWVENQGIIAIKDTEIEKLTVAALKRPNEYNHWWFLGGLVAGVVTTVVVGFAFSSTPGGVGP
jgi:hypothetical protein